MPTFYRAVSSEALQAYFLVFMKRLLLECAERLVATDGKSNEITAIPKLLDLFDFKGSVASIDAACQREIIKKIVDQGGDDILTLKANQGVLHGCTKSLYDRAKKFADFFEESGKGHGKQETRRCETLFPDDLSVLKKAADWPALSAVARVTAARTQGGKKHRRKHDYVASSPAGRKTLHQGPPKPLGRGKLPSLDA